MEFLTGAAQTIINFFKSIWDAFQRLFDWLNDAFDSIISFFKELPEWVFSNIADAIVDFFNSIPVPDFFLSASGAFNVIPPEVVYFAGPFNIGIGVSMVLGAYLLRFIVRRVPFFG